MPRSRINLLLHPFFLLSLFLLIANDHWWKHSYPSALTGKISDFAGVFVFAVFLIACFRFKRIYAVMATGILFCFWKSPLSGPFVEFFGLARVVDYTDLFALFILPLVFYIQPMIMKFSVKYFMPVLACITFSAIVATSLPYNVGGYRYPPGRVTVDKELSTKLTEAQIIHKLDSLQIPYTTEMVEYLPVNTRGLMMVTKSGGDTLFSMTAVDDLKDTVLYYKKWWGQHYVIPSIALETDTFTNVRFRIYDNGRKRKIHIICMTTPPKFGLIYSDDRTLRKRYLPIIRSLLLEN
jgi:hypothetical protein